MLPRETFLKTKRFYSEIDLNNRDFQTISEIVYRLSGIILKPEKKTMVHARLSRRLKDLNMTSYRQYVQLLEGLQGEKEIPLLLNAMTTNFTQFFREPHHFIHLKNKVIPKLRYQKRIRLWSAGCSTGQEPYSMAMTIRDSSLIIGSDIKILATDIDTEVLKKAKAGIYKKSEGIPASYIEKFCNILEEKQDHKIALKNSVKNLITFKHLNLLHSWPMKGPFDVIFCRNTVIYFDIEAQKKIFNQMADLLAHEGWLYIGHSENLFNITDRFKLVGKTIYQKAK